ncbi:MAG: methyltransferase domain-containing protein [Cyanobacteria bacterium P01_G01_bin.38]
MISSKFSSENINCSEQAADKLLPCPICHQSSELIFNKYGYWIRACQNCGHRFADLSPTAAHTHQVYGDDYFAGGGAGYPDYLAEANLLRRQGRRYGNKLKRYTQPGRVLDVGAAAGFILQGLMDTGWQGQGVEPNAGMAAHAREQLGLAVQTGTLENLSSEGQYDLITFIQVLPHFFNLRQALTVASEMTALEGYWLIETWNRSSWTARLLGQNWHEYSPPSVLHWFSLNDVSQLGRQFGFRTVAQGRPAKWINGAHAKSLFRYKLQGSPLGKPLLPLLKLVPDGLAFPYPAEDLFWILLQKVT